MCETITYRRSNTDNSYSPPINITDRRRAIAQKRLLIKRYLEIKESNNLARKRRRQKNTITIITIIAIIIAGLLIIATLLYRGV